MEKKSQAKKIDQENTKERKHESRMKKKAQVKKSITKARKNENTKEHQGKKRLHVFVIATSGLHASVSSRFLISPFSCFRTFVLS
jgi:hypothetical protein